MEQKATSLLSHSPTDANEKKCFRCIYPFLACVGLAISARGWLAISPSWLKVTRHLSCKEASLMQERCTESLMLISLVVGAVDDLSKYIHHIPYEIESMRTDETLLKQLFFFQLLLFSLICTQL